MAIVSKYLAVIACSALVLFNNSFAQEKKAIPDPLSLTEALSFSVKSHPVLNQANLDIKSAINSRNELENDHDINAYLEGRLRYIEPASIVTEQNNDDHRVGLIISKTLYDSGRNTADIDAAKLTIESKKVKKQLVLQQRRLDIMQKFFAVILADMNYYRYNEEIATAFISFDRTQDRLKLGQASDIDVLEKEVAYHEIRYLRIKSQNDQRKARAELAVAMGRPSELVTTVTKPSLKDIDIKLPDVEYLQKLALSNNYQLKILSKALAAAAQRVEVARNTYGPSVTLEAGSFAYSRERSSYDELQIGLVMRMPLFEGKRTSTEINKAMSKVYEIKNDIELLKTEIETNVLSLWLEFDALKGKLLQMNTQTDFRELYLDRSRAIYELEVKTDLGDAMARVSEAERDLLDTRYAMKLVLTQLEIEVGKRLQEFKKGTVQ